MAYISDNIFIAASELRNQKGDRLPTGPKNLDDLLGGSNIERKRQEEQSHNFMANRQERKRNIEGHKIKNIDQINC
jgi:hypothetical protein